MAKEAPELVKLTIDDVEYEVPKGMNLVDAAKLCGNDIPVFCYHPKLGHAANCRMCLVELATPRPNRETGELELAWFPNPITACNQYVVEGMTIRTNTVKVEEGRKAILEFLLSSHPLDCPVCDKGGECPLQNLTMRHGPQTSRMYWNDRMRLGKHIPLGELIYLDRERCIHCARCIRFQDIIADDPVLGFDMRGRKQQIITYSEPGFDSIFSGNTTDICPVGALTSADFRFNARPWEMEQVATLDTYTPEGSNMTFDTRTDRLAGGRTTIKRVMPRQNEQVNEIWISDKARFGRHYLDHADRLTRPMIRKGGKLVEATWDEALSEIAAQFKSAGDKVAAIAGPRLSNEDYFMWQSLVRALGGRSLAAYPNHVAGAEFTAQAGVGAGTSLLDLGKGDAVVVVASDLHEEAPIWWLRVKAAAERGATLVVISPRETRIEKWASHVVRVAYGEEIGAVNDLAAGSGEAAKAFADAENAVVFAGGEGLSEEASRLLAQASANLLNATGHVGKANNGLVMVWPGANLQGAYDMGFSAGWGPGYSEVDTGSGYAGILSGLSSNDIKAVVVAGADIAFDDAAADAALRETKAFIVVTDLFFSDTAQLADVVLPVQSIAERDGTYTNGERRVQRFYPAIEPIGESLPDWKIAGKLAEQLDQPAAPSVAALVFKNHIVPAVPQYDGMNYMTLARVEEQFPDVGGEDLYFGGTSFQNYAGLGQQWPSTAEAEALTISAPKVPGKVAASGKALVVVPVTRLYDREPLLVRSAMLSERLPEAYVTLNADDAEAAGVADGDTVEIAFDGLMVTAQALIDNLVPKGTALLPRRLQKHGTPRAATAATVSKLETVPA